MDKSRGRIIAMPIPEIKLNNGSTIPQLEFGTFRISNDDFGTECILNAIKVGYRHIDTAYNYKNEKNVAEAIKKSGVPREEFFLTTKIGFQDIVAKRTREAFFESLKNLGMDYVDMVLLHWAATNYLEAYQELLQLKKEGLIKNIGVSNFQIHHLECLAGHQLPTPVVNQIELHPLFQEKELKEYCLSHNIAIEAWSPLGGRDFPILDNPTIMELSQKYAKTSAQIILRWHLQEGHIIFPKSTKIENMTANITIFDFTLSEDDIEIIRGMDTGERLYWSPTRWD